MAVIDHIAAPGRETRAEVEANHRIHPETVRADFERAGFVFDGSSEMLRNPEDDHSKNVFDPAIRGRTDRFVYRFRRPALGKERPARGLRAPASPGIPASARNSRAIWAWSAKP